MMKQYDKEQIAKWIGIVTACLMGLFLVFLFWENQRISVFDVSGYDTASADKITYKFEKIVCKADYITIRGYAYEKGISVDMADTNVLAYDDATGTYYLLPTENRKENQITKDADDGFNYDYSRFESVVMRKKLPKGCQLFILYRNNGENILVQTDTVLD